MSSFAFDHCPVEILHMIFEYLSGNEILHSFVDTSLYMNKILKSYDKYNFDLTRITRQEFDFIFSYISLKRLFSIILSDEKLTGGQIQLFLSRYSSSFHRFTGLRCLTFRHMTIDQQKYQLILRAFQQLQNLRLLILDQIKLMNIHDEFTEGFNQLNEHCLVNIIESPHLTLIPLKTRLQYWSNSYAIRHREFLSEQWSQVRTVKFSVLSVYEFRINDFLSALPRLISLDMNTEDREKKSFLVNFDLAPNLRRLTFPFDESFTYLTTRTGLNTLKYLKQLEIKIYNCNDPLFLNGNQWERFIRNAFPYLSKFDFICHIPDEKNLSLDSFRTRFWFEEKKWFVALTKYKKFDGLKLLTVPHFNNDMEISRTIIETTLPSCNDLNLNIRDFHDEENHYDIPLCFNRYEHIERFHWEKISSFALKLNRICNLNSVKIVILPTYWMSFEDDFQKVLYLLDSMPNVFKIVFSEWPYMKSYSNLKCANSRVTSIELPYLFKCTIHSDYSDAFKGIFFHSFPNVKHIVINQAEIKLCYQFNKYFLPWENLSSLQIKCLNSAKTKEDENRKYNEWKEKFFNEILPQLTRRVFTFSDQLDKSKDHVLSIWFGQTRCDDEDDGISIVSKKTISCFQYKKCVLS
ncbi:unnamed protein product [Adineta ricciae]|uniref:F-box domain-containing protein n=1 Tax=Adineta ricciae TaxID=249248 RepID=A0A815TCR1_ADIRI|nr:unnamed protein product [Adineta ricciae]CAF1514270.1 unnamed protein product [Adineta ricciae]